MPIISVWARDNVNMPKINLGCSLVRMDKDRLSVGVITRF